jgi:uncharacterized protein (TIGR02996 family)
MPEKRREFGNRELALLASIHADPRDDAPRLIYADWLDEQGQSELAEFIRLQCKCPLDVFRPGGRHTGSWLVGPDVEQEYPDEWVSRLSDLVNTHGDEWYESFPRQSRSRNQAFKRGLPQVAARVADDAFRASSKAIIREVRPRHEVAVIVDCYEGGAGLSGFRSKLFERAARVAVQAFESRNMPGSSVVVPDGLVQQLLKHCKVYRYARVQFGLVSKEAATALAAMFPDGTGRSWNHGRF